MSTQLDQLRVEGLESRGAEVLYDVTGEAISAYAQATDDPSPAALEGRIATPVFAIVPVWAAITPASKAVATDEARKRVVHFGQDMVLYRPIEAGMTLVSTATPVALLQRRSGSALVIHTETRTTAGELANEQWVTEFFRGIDSPESRGEQPADHRLPAEVMGTDPVGEIVQAVADDQPDRYATASGDHFVIHLDNAAARALAFTARAVTEAAGGGDAARIAARFSAPVFPGDVLTTRVWELGDRTYGFEAFCAPDRTVIKDGLVQLR
jgi:acyl dehydratase